MALPHSRAAVQCRAGADRRGALGVDVEAIRMRRLQPCRPMNLVIGIGASTSPTQLPGDHRHCAEGNSGRI